MKIISECVTALINAYDSAFNNTENTLWGYSNFQLSYLVLFIVLWILNEILADSREV